MVDTQHRSIGVSADRIAGFDELPHRFLTVFVGTRKRTADGVDLDQPDMESGPLDGSIDGAQQLPALCIVQNLDSNWQQQERGFDPFHAVLHAPALDPLADPSDALTGYVQHTRWFGGLAVPIHAVRQPQTHVERDKALARTWVAVEDRQAILDQHFVDQPARRRHGLDLIDVEQVKDRVWIDQFHRSGFRRCVLPTRTCEGDLHLPAGCIDRVTGQRDLMR